MLLLLLACVDDGPAKGTETGPAEDSAADTGEPDSGEPDSGGSDTGEPEDTGIDGYSPVPEGFETELTRWVLWFSTSWGFQGRLAGANAVGDIFLGAAEIGSSDWEAGATYTIELTAAGPGRGSIAHWTGADCLLECRGCVRYGPIGYWATQGQLEVSLWEDHADIRLTDLVYHPEFEGEDVSVPLIEVTGVPIRVCPDLSDCD